MRAAYSRCRIISLILLSFCVVLSVPSLCLSESIEFDGYWWTSASEENRFGYIQGFIEGAGLATMVTMTSLIDTFSADNAYPREQKRHVQNLKQRLISWQPYNHTFGYYYERINGYYMTTQNMKTPVAKIMFDFFEFPKIN
jgi:hypothetical protein